MRHLMQAAQSGKEVTVVLELLARFDEEANIGWAKQLEEVGAHVVYGVVGYKTHAKLAMVVRREPDSCAATCTWYRQLLPRARRRCTPTSPFTRNDGITSDVNDIFIQLTGLGQAGEHNYLQRRRLPCTEHAGGDPAGSAGGSGRRAGRHLGENECAARFPRSSPRSTMRPTPG
ncbi:MAG: hypothetical protein U1E63_01700 [Burkholderiales bacterium]